MQYKDYTGQIKVARIETYAVDALILGLLLASSYQIANALGGGWPNWVKDDDFRPIRDASRKAAATN